MRDSAERIQYIADYLSSYKAKIESLNKNGLFDAATLYELFASEVCRLWFGQVFKNLNTVRSNYPYVDLVSEDEAIYVQVSTGQDIPGKVKSTLEKIKESKDRSFSRIKTLYFFVLGNDSIDSVPEYAGEGRIGNIDFQPETHLISIAKIISKAATDLEFQQSLYELLHKESEYFRTTAEKFADMLADSRALIQTQIDDLINGEYEISRDDLLSTIRAEDYRNISVIGDAGSGKSALCKKLISREDLVLFTRAERIGEVTDIDDIWGLGVRQLLRYLNGRRIVFYVDALEFIADGSKTNIDRLQGLYEATRDFDNAHVLTSCRTCDKNAFLRLTSTYEIQEYKVPELSEPEIAQVAAKYPIIRDLWQQNRYAELLKSPFYLNIIVKQIKSVDDLSGTNGLREFIWDNVICLKNKLLPAGVTSDDVRDAVNTIVFTRARDFSIGIPKDDVPNHALKALLSNGVVIQTNGKLRLTYDIFEDICFEQRFDREFDGCKGDFCAFFTNLHDLGRCVYRRYQIWVENKLFIKEGRENFLYSLAFSDNIPDDWKKQTIIGITKSRFCKYFFAEYGQDLIERGLFADFVEITNLYAFEARTVARSNGNQYAFLRPIGVGREQLIQMAKENYLLDKPESKIAILKLCTDYAKSTLFDGTTAKAACEILETQIDQLYQDTARKQSYSTGTGVIDYLHSLYFMAEFCAEWLRDFWTIVLAEYKTYSRSAECRLAAEILKDIFKSTTPALTNALPSELTELAWVYWVDQPDRRTDPYRYHSSLLDIEERYGLNANASNYSHVYRTAEENTLLKYLSMTQFEAALHWVIKLTNYATDNLRERLPDKVCKVELVEYPSQAKYSLWGTDDYFFAGINEYSVPDLLGDAVFSIRQTVFDHIEHHLSKGDKEYCTLFVNWLKKSILKEANNTMLLSLLEDIGLIYPIQFPGFSIFFASSIDYVMMDTYRELAQMGMSLIRGTRYQSKKQPVFSLKEYIARTQIIGRPEDKENCEQTIDYLYSIIPNDNEHASEYLQIQKMDMRGADQIPVKDNWVCYMPRFTGAAKEAADNYEKSSISKEQRAVSRLEQKYKDSKEESSLSLEECLSGIEELGGILASPDNGRLAEGTYIKYIACALTKDDLDTEARSALCQRWIDGINRLENGLFVYDRELTYILFEQADRELTREVQEALKRLFLTVILNESQNGLISSFQPALKKYLSSNEHWAHLLFDTVLMLAHDSMLHSLYNAHYLERSPEKNAATEYQPNISSSLLSADHYIKEQGGMLFQSQREAIIRKYLLNEDSIPPTDFTINEYDIAVLCHLANCGVHVASGKAREVFKAILHQMIEIWYTNDQTGTHTDAIDAFSESEMSAYLKDELINSGTTDLVIDMMLSETDYSKFVSDTYEFYEEVLIGYLPQYVDAYDNASERRRYKSITERIENQVLRITDEKARIQLYRVLFLPSPKFYHGDWSNCRTCYSYLDKQFINSLWEKYGQYHLKALLTALFELHTCELLPEVLPAVSLSFSKAREQMTDSVGAAISQNRVRINEIITTAFVDKEDQIKRNAQWTEAFESFLDLLIEFNVEMAAVILDEFRIH